MRSKLLPGGSPVRRLGGWRSSTRQDVGLGSRDGWSGRRWMISLRHFVPVIAGFVENRW